MNPMSVWLFFLFVIAGMVVYLLTSRVHEPFANPSDFRKEKEYSAQVKLVSDRFAPLASSKRPVADALEQSHMPEAHRCLINFFALACRYPAYIGPTKNGYFDADIGIQMAVSAGCRVFVLDIDYLDICRKEAVPYFPRLVVRNIQGKLEINEQSNQPLCNVPQASNLKEVCEKINTYAYASGTQNASDPLMIVLYFHRQPPGSYKSKAVLDYYSQVAKALAPFQPRLLTNEIAGGTFYRQKQESRLLMNPITTYNGKVLIVSNANTSGFREDSSYSPMDDLDYLTNLRLSYTQTKLGVTENDAGAIFGVLQTVEDYMVIPTDRTEQVKEETKLRWTIALPTDPLASIPKETYAKVSSMGVNCIPITLFDSTNEYLFGDQTFKKHAWLPKPEPLRYIKPPVITPAEPNPSMNANQGMLRAPTI